MKPTTFVVLLFCALIVGIAILVMRSDGARNDDPAASGNRAPDTVVLRGASQFDRDHAFTRTILKFAELVEEYYDGPVEFNVYLNSELGLEKDYFAYMSQGISVDYGIVSPAHMSTFSDGAPLIDMPFLFRDIDHWNKVLDSDAFQPIADEVQQKSDVMIVGYAGGGTRNLIVNRPVTNMTELKGLNLRVMGAPIQTRIFQAIQASPSVISYSEIYNAIQTGVIDAAENEAAGIQQMKFYEVGPEISLTQHAITVRPLCFSGKTFRRLPEDLQTAITRAGREAGAYGRHLESTEDAEILARMEADGLLRLHPFTEREELMRLADPVKAAYAKEINAEDVFSRVNAVQ